MEGSLLEVIRKRNEAVGQGVNGVIRQLPITATDPNAGVDTFTRAQALVAARAEDKRRKEQKHGKKGKHFKGGKGGYKGSSKTGPDTEPEKSAFWLFVDGFLRDPTQPDLADLYPEVLDPVHDTAFYVPPLGALNGLVTSAGQPGPKNAPASLEHDRVAELRGEASTEGRKSRRLESKSDAEARMRQMEEEDARLAAHAADFQQLPPNLLELCTPVELAALCKQVLSLVPLDAAASGITRALHEAIAHLSSLPDGDGSEGAGPAVDGMVRQLKDWLRKQARTLPALLPSIPGTAGLPLPAPAPPDGRPSVGQGPHAADPHPALPQFPSNPPPSLHPPPVLFRPPPPTGPHPLLPPPPVLFRSPPAPPPLLPAWRPSGAVPLGWGILPDHAVVDPGFAQGMLMGVGDSSAPMEIDEGHANGDLARPVEDPYHEIQALQEVPAATATGIRLPSTGVLAGLGPPADAKRWRDWYVTLAMGEGNRTTIQGDSFIHPLTAAVLQRPPPQHVLRPVAPVRVPAQPRVGAPGGTATPSLASPSASGDGSGSVFATDVNADFSSAGPARDPAGVASPTFAAPVVKLGGRGGKRGRGARGRGRGRGGWSKAPDGRGSAALNDWDGKRLSSPGDGLLSGSASGAPDGGASGPVCPDGGDGGAGPASLTAEGRASGLRQRGWVDYSKMAGRPSSAGVCGPGPGPGAGPAMGPGPAAKRLRRTLSKVGAGSMEKTVRQEQTALAVASVISQGAPEQGAGEQTAQIAAAAGLLAAAPDDEVLAELLALQAELAAQVAVNRVRAARVITAMAPDLPALRQAALRREEAVEFVRAYTEKHKAVQKQMKAQRRQDKVREDFKKAQEVVTGPRKGGRPGWYSDDARPVATASPPSADKELVDRLAERTEDEEALCTVCGEGHSFQPNEIVFCDRCEMGVHQACYGLDVIPEGDWLCWPCAVYEEAEKARGIPQATIRPPRWQRRVLAEGGARSTKCSLCPVHWGAFRQTVDGKLWVHQVCAMWHPEVTLKPGGGRAVVDNVMNIKRERWDMACSVCGRKEGAVIRCSAPQCTTAFHPLCARNEGNHYLCIRDAGPRLQYRAYCPVHAPAQQERDLEAQAPTPGILLAESAMVAGTGAGPGAGRGGRPLMLREDLLAARQDLEMNLQKREELRKARLELESLRILLDLVRRREKFKRNANRAFADYWWVRLRTASGDVPAAVPPEGSPAPAHTAVQYAQRHSPPVMQSAGSGPYDVPAQPDQDTGRGGAPESDREGEREDTVEISGDTTIDVSTSGGPAYSPDRRRRDAAAHKRTRETMASGGGGGVDSRRGERARARSQAGLWTPQGSLSLQLDRECALSPTERDVINERLPVGYMFVPNDALLNVNPREQSAPAPGDPPQGQTRVDAGAALQEQNEADTPLAKQDGDAAPLPDFSTPLVTSVNESVIVPPEQAQGDFLPVVHPAQAHGGLLPGGNVGVLPEGSSGVLPGGNVGVVPGDNGPPAVELSEQDCEGVWPELPAPASVHGEGLPPDASAAGPLPQGEVGVVAPPAEAGARGLLPQEEGGGRPGTPTAGGAVALPAE